MQYIAEISLCMKSTQPSQAYSDGYTFSATATAWHRGVALYLGRIN